MNEFKRFHPVVNFTYFLFVIGFSCFFMHPLYSFISLICAFWYLLILKGKKAIKTNLLFILPVIILSAIINPLFNHQGVTVIAYLMTKNPVTVESIFYGIASGMMIGSVICWFSCYNEVMTSDKFIYLFGKIIPSLSLVLSLTLRFVPLFSAQLKKVINAQKCMGRDVSKGNKFKRLKTGILIVSIMVTWSLENAIDTADSMKSRGYGIKGRTTYSIYSFKKYDFLIFMLILCLSLYILSGKLTGGIYFEFFPSIVMGDFTFWEISYFVLYLCLCALPVIIELKEEIKWKYIKSKI